MSDPAVFDRSAALDRIDGDEELLNEVLEVFACDMPQKVEALNRALKNDDAAAAAFKAHSIKGACLSIGAEVVARLAYEIEAAAKQGRLSDVGSFMPEFERALDTLQSTIGKSWHSETA